MIFRDCFKGDTTVNLENVIENLKNDLKFSKKVIHIEEIPAREAEYCDIPNLPNKISNFLDKENIKLFKHQCELINFIRKGKNVIITTPTASGKTLAFSLPILEKFNDDLNATALFLYPKNSLINDQYEKFLKYQEKTGMCLNHFKYTRDTNPKERPQIREKVKMLLTNTYMLHQILYWHFQWCDFYSNLKYVVIDEAHEYNGVFGSEVALLIRRLRRIANFYGSNPQFILSSATLPNPLEFSEQLIGKKFELVNEDTSSCGRKFMVFYNPYVEEENPSTEMDTRDLFVVFTINGFQTLCFRRSNDKVEKTIPLIKKYLKTKKPELEDMIASYRAGYNPEDRKRIETKLKNKELIGITSTNALEAGIDIGSLDVVIISEYPGTCMATWQQAGRAGRGTDDSSVVFIASKDPLNQYIVKNPEFILGKPHENATIDLKNEYLLKKHVKCAAAELSVTPYEAEYYFGLNHQDITRFEEEGILKAGFIGWDYINSNVNENPAFKEQLGNITDSDFKVIHNGKIKENISKEDAYKIAYKGAVYRNQGKFVVKNFDLETKKIELKKIKKKDIKTNWGSWKKTEVKVSKTLKTKNYDSLKLYFGELEMVKTFFTYEKVNGHRTNFKELEVPPVTFLTKGLWLKIPEHILQKLENKFSSTEIIKMSVNGVLSSLTAMFPYYVLCGKDDIGGHYNQNKKKKDIFEEDILFFYDTAPGGVGLVEKGIEKFPELIQLTLDMVKECKCEDGCGSCIYSNPYTINYFGKMNKKGTIFLFEQLLEELKPENDEVKTLNTLENTTETRSLEPKENSKDKTSHIFTLLHDRDSKNRAHAAYLLGERGDPKYVDVLCKATEDIDGNVRRLSASALGKIGDKKAENSLIKLLKDEKPQVRQYAAKALRKIDSNDNLRHRNPNEEESIKTQNNNDIISTLENDRDSKNRAHAAYLLGETGNPEYVDVLCKATEDIDGNVRRLSASALGKIGDKRAKNALIKLLKDEKPQVRQYALKALGKIASK